jgi:hypothetical protein
MGVEGKWDCFISYASNDRETVASLLANELQAKGLRVWFDQFEIKPGMQLLRSINEGLANSKVGIVILSQNGHSENWQDCIVFQFKKAIALSLSLFGIKLG